MKGIETAASPVDEPAAEAPVNDAPATKARILVAEDNEINRKIAVLLLERLGYTADPVVNGIQAVQAASSIDYDLILMDCQMPEMDGYQATTEIRKLEASSHSHVPIVALTAHAMPGDREKCIESGMDDYIAKPYTLAILGAGLRKWLGE